MNTAVKPLNREGAARRYTELMHIIEIGAYSESPPDDYEGDWEDDGSYWYGDMNISEELSDLEGRAQAEGLKFVSTEPYKANTAMTYILEPMTEEEKAELAAINAAHRDAGIAAAFQWQDEGKVAVVDHTVVLGKHPETGAYLVLVGGTADEGYTYPIKLMLTIKYEDGQPVIDEATEEQILQVQEHVQAEQAKQAQEQAE